MEGRTSGYTVGQHYTGVRGVRQYSNLLRSRAATSLAWRNWGRVAAARAFGVAGGAVGTAATLGYLGYQGAMAMRKRMMKKVRRKVPRRIPKRRVPTKVLGKRKRSVRYGPRTRRGIVRSRASAGEYSTLKLRGPGPRPVSNKIAKALTVDKRILRFQAINQQNTAESGVVPGALQLYNYNPASGVTGCPIHIFDLTRTQNVAIDERRVASLMSLNPTSGNVGWEQITGQIAAGTFTATEWQLEYGDNTNLQLAKARICPQWYDIRLMCYGARAQPTKYTIMVCQFKRDHLVPHISNAAELEPGDDDHHVVEYHGFWQALAKKHMYNAITPAQNRDGGYKNLRILKRVSFTLQSSQNTDLDVSPPCKEVRMFVRDGRLLNYQSATLRYVNDAGVFGGGWLVNTPGTGQRHNDPVYERARTFLLVMATNTTQSVDVAGLTSDNTPSYDICIRKKEAYDSH